MPLISVIIPVYNASNTIKRCIESIVSNNAEIEIICVDDGSKDDSLQVLNEISLRDKRIKVFHQENTGAGEARNKGLSLANGEYVMFCDADDSYLPTTIDLICEDIEKYNADYIVFHRQTETLDGAINYWGGKEERVVNLNCTWYNYLNDFMIQRGHGLVVFTKVFRKSLIDKYNIRFERFTFSEDTWFNLLYISKANVFIEDYRAYYKQYQTEGSICLRPYKNYFELNMECPQQYVTTFPKEATYIKKFLTIHTYHSLVWASTRILMGIDAKTHIEKYRMLKSLFNKPAVKQVVNDYMDTCSIDESDKARCSYIANESILQYAIRFYYLSKVKATIVKLIRK